MPADQIRNRTVGCKMTDNEYERLAAVAEGDGMTLGEWGGWQTLNGREDFEGCEFQVPQPSPFS
jgi:hypothetical protein